MPNEMGRFDRERTFGIEIEAYNCASARVAEALTEAGILCQVEQYGHTTRRHWKIVSDGSVTGPNPFELVSPPLKGDEGLEEIRKVCAILKSLDVKVNRSTGLHVHHDAHGLNVDAVKSVLTMWWKYEDVLLYFLPPSRRANMYCKPAFPHPGSERIGQGYNWQVGSDAVEGWRRAIDGISNLRQLGESGSFQDNRYAPVNCHALERHGTLEFRAHAGTTEFSKIQAWIVLTQWFVTRSKERGCMARTRMSGRWSEETRFFWKAIDWINLDDPQVIKAKNTLRIRFNHFKEMERGGEMAPVPVLTRMDEHGRLRPTAAAGQQEPGEV